MGEGVWRRGEGVGWVNWGEVATEDGERRVRRMSTSAGLERTVRRSCLSDSLSCSCPCGDHLTVT